MDCQTQADYQPVILLQAYQLTIQHLTIPCLDKCHLHTDIHCQQHHKSNALKCPVVKAFRAELRRKLPGFLAEENSGSLHNIPSDKDILSMFRFSQEYANKFKRKNVTFQAVSENGVATYGLTDKGWDVIWDMTPQSMNDYSQKFLSRVKDLSNYDPVELCSRASDDLVTLSFDKRK